MRYNRIFKGLAILLAALALVAAFFSAMTVCVLLSLDLYDLSLEEVTEQTAAHRMEYLADSIVRRYAVEQFSDCPEVVLERRDEGHSNEWLSENINLAMDSWSYTLSDAQGNTLEEYTTGKTAHYTYSDTRAAQYPVMCSAQEADTSLTEGSVTYYYRYTESPEYTITIRLAEDAITYMSGLPVTVWEGLYQHCYAPVYTLAACALVFLGCLVYLCCAAGRSRRHTGIVPGGLNRLPLDVYMAAAAGAAAMLIKVAAWVSPWREMGYFSIYSTGTANLSLLQSIVCAVLLFLAAFVGMCFLFAFAAQVKAPKHFWWRNSLIGRILKLIKKLLLKLFFILRRVFRMLPLMWRWLLTGALIVFCLGMSLLLRSDMLIVLSLLFGFGMTLYGAYSFAAILQGARRMAAGELNAHIPENRLWGDYRELAAQLNALSHVVVEASDARLRSERMKTELITNVSHDIKTPLTSIINYVDLLKAAKDEETQWEYLQVLDRQSLRLKKLIDDLMELSKASSGSIQANIAPLDATEALKQALGEFSDKLQLSQLNLCTVIPEETVMINADGRLFWRVLANLMGNVVKYAQPGTRVYVTLQTEGKQAKIAVKNISREPLNISAQELMERFVRGDASRNTEGSGLGLSIAGSLMEVQKGDLQLQIDGDLFKATLSFPLSQKE